MNKTVWSKYIQLEVYSKVETDKGVPVGILSQALFLSRQQD